MSEDGWLAAAMGDRSVAELARALLARAPILGLQDRSLAARLSKTDRGQCPASWWDAHPALVRALAEELERSVEEVGAWARRRDAGRGTPTALPGHPVLRGLDLADPPPWLWPGDVLHHLCAEPSRVRLYELSIDVRRRAWFVVEPGLPRTWLPEAARAKGWRVVRADRWDRALPELTAGERTLVLLDEGPTTPPRPPEGGDLVVAAPCPLPPGADGWTRLNRSGPPPAGRVLAWFRAHTAAGLLIDETAFRDLVERAPELGPGELLSFLEHGSAASLLASRPEIDPERMVAAEARALGEGCGPARSLDGWKRLLAGESDDGSLLPRLEEALLRNKFALAQRLVQDQAHAVVANLRLRGLLQPDPAGTGAWLLWPRWLGTELRTRAAAEGRKERAGLGAALLAEEPIALAAWTALLEDARAGRFDALLQRTGAGGRSPAELAATEGIALALGHHLLDGGDVPREVCAQAALALLEVRGRTGKCLLTRGVGVFGRGATGMAEWTLALQAGLDDPRLAPWRSGADLEPALSTLHDALDRWCGQPAGTWRMAGSWRYSPVDLHVVDESLARRCLRLGSLLHRAVGLLPGPRQVVERAVWPFQVPALLGEACRDETVLPGRSRAQVLHAQDPALDPEALEAMAGATANDGESILRGIAAQLTLGIADGNSDARLRKAALHEVIQEIGLRFALIRGEVTANGGSFHEVVRWLWSHWTRSARPADEPAIALLKQQRREDAALVWRNAPPEVPREIWEAASRHDALWAILEEDGWLAWGRQGLDVPAGWQAIPVDILARLLGPELPEAGWRAAWVRAPDAALAWVTAQLGGDGPPAAALATIPEHRVSDLLDRGGADLPAAWLQEVVWLRREGWRVAWNLLDREDGGS